MLLLVLMVAMAALTSFGTTSPLKSICDKRKVDPWIGNQISLELSQIDIKCYIKSQGGSDGRYNLTNQPIQIEVGRPLNVQVATTNVINGLIVNHECTVRVLKGCVGCQDCIVRLNNSSGYLRGRID